MREILFRGKTINSEEWAEGNYLYDEFSGTSVIVPYINLAGDVTDFSEHSAAAVITDTVGQYTGLTDKNGKKIFEGDIVKCTDETNDYSFTAVVMFGNPNGEYNWGFQLKRIKGANANTDILLWVEMGDTGAYIEVVGNIHDNPELLEQGG